MADPAAAFVASGSRARTKYDALPNAPVATALTADERAALAAECEARLPRFAHRVKDAKASIVGAPFFKHVRVLELVSVHPFPACTAFAALLPDHRAVVLSGQPDAFDVVCAAERPAHVDDEDLALMLGLIAGHWTSASLHKELRVTSTQDIPWQSHGQEVQTAVHTLYGSEVRPAVLEGGRATLWVVSESWLRRREIEIGAGRVKMTETPIVQLPVPPGRMWGMRNGRLEPIG